ncbi:hypothetical protein BD779DRAFT_1526162 [Infundibulicybe gibba]|nr:hypothetical protein BD779DRAFT_1526162 [Infundibulicybe gibba]
MADDGDMRGYIEGCLLGSIGSFQRLLSANPSLHEDVITGIVEKADGMFLLAQLHMNSLEKKVRLMDLRRALAEPLLRRLRVKHDVVVGAADQPCQDDRATQKEGARDTSPIRPLQMCCTRMLTNSFGYLAMI